SFSISKPAPLTIRRPFQGTSCGASPPARPTPSSFPPDAAVHLRALDDAQPHPVYALVDGHRSVLPQWFPWPGKHSGNDRADGPCSSFYRELHVASPLLSFRDVAVPTNQGLCLGASRPGHEAGVTCSMHRDRKCRKVARTRFEGLSVADHFALRQRDDDVDVLSRGTVDQGRH